MVPGRPKRRAPVGLALTLLAACGAAEAPPASGLLPAGASCGLHSQCRSGACVLLPGGLRCAEACAGDSCPAPLVCRRRDGRDLSSPGICVPPSATLCHACRFDEDCGPHGELCLPDGAEGRCGQDCSEEGCPAGYACTSVTAGGLEIARQCWPLTGSCSCGPQSAGATRPCQRSLPGIGTCLGLERCDPLAGWEDCDAPLPALEVCNGQDDDCDEAVDEDASGQPLARACGYGPAPRPPECVGQQPCQATGWGPCSRSPPPPVELACDGLDDDCDGATDEDLLGGPDHCGGCGRACAPGPDHDDTTLRRCDGGQCRRPLCRFPWYDLDGDIASAGCETAEDTVVIAGLRALNDHWSRARQLGTIDDSDERTTPLCGLRLLRDDPANHEPPVTAMGADFYSWYLIDGAWSSAETTLHLAFGVVERAFTLWLCGTEALADLATEPPLFTCWEHRIERSGQLVSQPILVGASGLGDDSGYYYALVTYARGELVTHPGSYALQLTDDLGPTIGGSEDLCAYD